MAEVINARLASDSVSISLQLDAINPVLKISGLDRKDLLKKRKSQSAL